MGWRCQRKVVRILVEPSHFDGQRVGAIAASAFAAPSLLGPAGDDDDEGADGLCEHDGERDPQQPGGAAVGVVEDRAAGPLHVLGQGPQDGPAEDGAEEHGGGDPEPHDHALAEVAGGEVEGPLPLGDGGEAEVGEDGDGVEDGEDGGEDAVEGGEGEGADEHLPLRSAVRGGGQARGGAFGLQGGMEGGVD